MSRAAADQHALTGLVGLLQAPGLHVRQMVAFLVVAAVSSITPVRRVVLRPPG